MLGLLIWASAAAAAHDAPPRYPVRVGDKMGAIDADGRLVIPARFGYLSDFKDGAAILIENDRYGFVDWTGRVVAPPKYHGAEPFSGGLAWVATAEDADGWKSWTAIDRTGRELFAPRVYKEVFGFADGVAWVDPYQPGTPHVVDARGRRVFADEQAWVSPMREGLAAFRPAGSSRWGYVDRAGRVAISPRFDDAEAFGDGLAPVVVEGAWAYVRPDGRVAFEVPGASGAWPFVDGLSAVRVGGRWGFVDVSGRWAIPPRYDSAREFDGPRAIVGQGPDAWGVIDRAGTVLVPFEHREMRAAGPDLYFVWPKQGDGYVVDARGRRQARFDASPLAYGFDGPLAQVSLGRGLNGYVDRDGIFVWKDRD